MKIKYLKLVAIVLTVMLVFSIFVACKKSDDQGTTTTTTKAGTTTTKAATTTTTATTATTTTTEAAKDYDPIGKYDPEITITTGRRAIAGINFAKSQTVDDNNYYKGYREELGIILTNDWVVDLTQYVTRVNIAIASGDIPDFFHVDATQFTQLAQQGLLADLTEAYKYTSVNTKSILEGIPAVLDAARYQGILMAIPKTGLFQMNQLWIREDWRISLGLPEPKTMDDLIKLALAFTNDDPDKNGIDDTTGFAMRRDFAGANSTFDAGMATVFNGHHAYPGMWIKNSAGELVYGSIQPETRVALLALQELYKAGAIDAEFSVKDSGKAFEYVTTGVAGIFTCKVWGAPAVASVRTNNPDAWIRGFSIPSVDSKPALPGTNLAFDGMFVVSKDCEYPEAVMKLANFGNEYGTFNEDPESNRIYGSNTVDGVFEDYGEGAAIQVTDILHHVRVSAHLMDYWAGKMENLPSKTTNWFWFYVDSVKEYTEKGDDAAWYNHAIWGPDNSGATILLHHYNNDLYRTNEYAQVPTATMILKDAILKDMELAVFTAIIMGSPIEDFDKYVNDWNSGGGDQITKEMNEWYKAKSGN